MTILKQHMLHLIVAFIGATHLVVVEGAAFSEFSSSNPSGNGVSFQGDLVDRISSVRGSSTLNIDQSDEQHVVTGVLVNPAYTDFEAAGSQNVEEFTTVMEANRNKAATLESQKAISGTLFSIGSNTIPKVTIDAVATNNNAITENGRGISGNQNLFTNSNGSSVHIRNQATNNEANSLGFDPHDSIAGTSNAFGNFHNGNITIVDVSTANDAESNKMEGTNGQTNAGSIFGAGYIGNSFVDLTRTVSRSRADGHVGTVVAGIQSNIGNMSDTHMVITDLSEENLARGGKSTKAIAGIQTNAHNITKSTIDMDMVNRNNVAWKEDNQTKNAIAGMQMNVMEVVGSDVSISSLNVDNKASVRWGPAISGSQTNIKTVTSGSNVELDMRSENNTATVLADGDAIAGNSVQVRSIVDSNLTMNGISRGNLAKVEGVGDAIAGNSAQVLLADRSNIIVNSNSYNNTAFANNGNAITGHSVRILDPQNQTNVTINNVPSDTSSTVFQTLSK